MENGFVFNRDRLIKESREASKELVYYPSIIGMHYYYGNDKYYEALSMSQEDRQRYIGQRVQAGGHMKGYCGYIVDVIPDEDIPGQDWFIVKEENVPTHFERWDKNELQKIVVTTALVPLD